MVWAMQLSSPHRAFLGRLGHHPVVRVMLLWAWLPRAALAAVVPTGGPTEPTHAAEASLRQALAHPGLRGARLGVAVQRLDTGEHLFAHDSQAQLIPASNVKLITSAAALSILGADYQFKTEFLGNVDAVGNIESDLTVVGYGDPYLLPERISYLVSRLYFMGVREVHGDVVVDDAYFDPSTRMAQGWQEDLTSNAYMAPAGALSVGFNAVMVHVLPGLGNAPWARVMVDPQQAYAQVTGTVATVDGGMPTRLNVDVAPRGNSSAVRVSGNISRSDPGRAYWRRIDNPPMFAGEVLMQALRKQGIAVAGQVRGRKNKPSAPVLLTALSPRLSELLLPLNKYSNNFMAMQMALVLGAHRYGAPATWNKAAQALQNFLADDVGIQKGSYTLGNASGLHSVNRLSAAQLLRLLRHMHDSPALACEFTNSLAVAAGSGTLAERMVGGPAAHLLRAKTGTLSKASALSGYLTTHEGVPLAFSLLVNNYRHIAEVWAAQDGFAEAMAKLKLSSAADPSSNDVPSTMAEEGEQR